MKIQVKEIRNIASQILLALGINEKETEIIIDSYLEADLCGVSTHGFNIFPEHIKKFINGTYPIHSNIVTEKETCSFSVLNANSAIGPVAAEKAMQFAVQKAKKSGIYYVFVRNANTFGPAFVYNNIALNNKMIGITFSNSPAQMAPIGGIEKLIGTNPMAISIPAEKENPIIYDIATSQVAKSKIKEALQEGRDIPIDWATDSKGIPTTDPKEAINGLVLPMAGYKGYGLSVCIDILSGLISGASYLNNVGRFYGNENCMNVGFTMIAMDPVQILDTTFFEKVDEYIRKIKNSTKAENQMDIKIPGENRIELKKQNLKEGIELNEDTMEKLKNYANKLR